MLRLDWNLLFTIINLLILYLLMKKFLYKPVLGIIEKRRSLVEAQLNNSAEIEKQANELKAQYEEKLLMGNAEYHTIIEESKKKGELAYEAIIEKANAEAQKILIKAEKKIEREKENALVNLKDEIGMLAIEAAEKIINDKATLGRDCELYDDFLVKVGGSDGEGDK
ncbi:F0F1 ATP synthase subunit B [Alloiococcus sp. CFN-8]|uniref:F0F1 ATP synthase subunit B n=1 Tax=Alloiococcus sp. CFN-8 TaxID=3416081 RepID=UPI003CE764A6